MLASSTNKGTGGHRAYAVIMHRLEAFPGGHMMSATHVVPEPHTAVRVVREVLVRKETEEMPP